MIREYKYIGRDEGVEGEYSEHDMFRCYLSTVDHGIYPSYSGWKWDMLRRGIFTLAGECTASCKCIKKHSYEKMMENIIEVTWIFNQLSNNGKIRSLPEIADSRSVMDSIELISKEFEKKYAATDWETGEFDYYEEIESFASQELIKLYGRPCKYELDRMITLSTAHIRPETGKWIDSNIETLPVYRKDGYGWFIFTQQVSVNSEIPPDLKKVIMFGLVNNYEILCLDGDAGTIDSLPVYEW